MAKSVRIWQKKQVRLDHLTFRQRDMVEIGAAGLLAVKKRLAAAQGPGDGPAKPLVKRYAIRKSKLRKGNRRYNVFPHLERGEELYSCSPGRRWVSLDLNGPRAAAAWFETIWPVEAAGFMSSTCLPMHRS